MIANILIAVGFFSLGFLLGGAFAIKERLEKLKEDPCKHIIVYEVKR